MEINLKVIKERSEAADKIVGEILLDARPPTEDEFTDVALSAQDVPRLLDHISKQQKECVDLVVDIDTWKRRAETLEKALCKSLERLNSYSVRCNGGRGRTFASPEHWVNRLIEIGDMREDEVLGEKV